LYQEKYLAYFAIFYSYIRPLNALLIFYGALQYGEYGVKKGIRFLSRGAFLGIVLMTISIPITHSASTICANYIYLFDDLSFAFGLSIFLSCILVVALITLPNMVSAIFCASALVFIYSYWKISSEVYYPLDESSFFEMLFSSSASILELLYIMFSYRIIMLYLGKSSGPFCRFIDVIAVVAAFWVILAHIRFDIDSADFLISIWLHESYIKITLIFTIICSTIYHVLKLNNRENALVFYPLILLALGFFIDFIQSEKGIVIGFCSRHSLHSVSSVIMVLVYSTMCNRSKFMRRIAWQIKTYAIGSILYMSLSLGDFSTMSVYIKPLSLLLIIIGILLFLSISFNNILQIYKSRKNSEII
jgi:hypothetical protein